MASTMLSVRSPFVSSTRALVPRPRISAARAPVVQRRSFVVRAVSSSLFLYVLTAPNSEWPGPLAFIWGDLPRGTRCCEGGHGALARCQLSRALWLSCD